jgi:hypothetical protein
MLQPWRAWVGEPVGAGARFFDNPFIEIVLVCYEQLITWPILQSMIHRPDVIVAIGNG